MSYSIKAFLDDYANKRGLHKVGIRVIYKRKIVKEATDFRVEKNQFKDGEIINHKQASRYNAIIRKQISDIETRLLDTLRLGKINANVLQQLVKDKKTGLTTIDEFNKTLIEQLKGKISEGRLKHYKSVVKKFTEWKPLYGFENISVEVLNEFEAHIRKSGLDGNSINSNMKLLTSFLRKASTAGLMDIKQIAGYRVPPYRQKLVEYLTEDEITKLKNLIDVIEKPTYKTVGYYFLLSCYTGYRISDLKVFNEKMIHDNNIVLRTTKNKQIVSIPVFPNLKKVIDYLKDKPFRISEQKFREYLKELTKLAGIRKNVKPHTGRHTFAMMLMNKGFSRDEVAEMLGDTIVIAKVYARISNEHLSKKVKERLG